MECPVVENYNFVYIWVLGRELVEEYLEGARIALRQLNQDVFTADW